MYDQSYPIPFVPYPEASRNLAVTCGDLKRFLPILPIIPTSDMFHTREYTTHS